MHASVSTSACLEKPRLEFLSRGSAARSVGGAPEGRKESRSQIVTPVTPDGFVRALIASDGRTYSDFLAACGRIGQATLDILDCFHHPGFSAFEGEGVAAADSAARERLASYIIHAPFSLARLHYDRDAGIVTYDPRPCSRANPLPTAAERFSPLDALAALTAHIPEKGQQVVRYYGYYSNKARGQRRRRQQCAAGITPVAVSAPEAEPDDFRRHCKRAWARLMRKVWAADPLACPKCGRPLRIISFIENPAVIEKILRHLKIWDSPERSPPPKVSTVLETDADLPAWEAAGRLFDGID